MQFELQSKLRVTNDTVLSIPNGYANGAFPYWISNPTGAKIIKLKVMLGRVIADKMGGTIEIKAWKTHNPVDNEKKFDIPAHNAGLTKNEIESNWEFVDSIDYTLRDADVNYASDFKFMDVIIPESFYLLGTIDITGGLEVVNVFMWVEYENNPLNLEQ